MCAKHACSQYPVSQGKLQHSPVNNAELRRDFIFHGTGTRSCFPENVRQRPWHVPWTAFLAEENQRRPGHVSLFVPAHSKLPCVYFSFLPFWCNFSFVGHCSESPK